MNPALVPRVFHAMILCAVTYCAAAAWAAPSPLELGDLRKGTYAVRGEDIRVRLPAALGNDVWKREFMEITDQFEVHFGDRQCRRYYLKRIGGPVGEAIGADAAQQGDEAVLRRVAAQLAARRGEDLRGMEWLQTRLGMALLAMTTDARGWPCLQAFPEGGQTIAADLFLLRGGQLYEIGYQAGIGPAEPVEAVMAAARSEAASFLDGIELPGTDKVEPVFPWRAGDPPPRLAGVALGDTLEVVESHAGPLGKFDEGDWRLEDEKRRLLIIVTAEKGAELVSIGNRDDGDIGGVRVGDRFKDIVGKWGAPPEGGPIMPGTDLYMYRAGDWGVTLTVTKGRVDSLSIAFGETHEEPRPLAATGVASQEPVQTEVLPPEEQMSIGQRFLLPAGALANHTGDSVAQQAPGREIVVLDISGITTSPPVLPGSGPARDRLAELLHRGPVMIEITSAVSVDWGRKLTARVMVEGRDLATTMVEQGWAIAIKSRAADPRLLAAEAQARAGRRGLWGMRTDEFDNTSPDDYFALQISMGLEPEVYLPGK